MTDRQMIERLITQLTHCAMEVRESACTCPGGRAEGHGDECIGLQLYDGYIKHVEVAELHLGKKKKKKGKA